MTPMTLITAGLRDLLYDPAHDRFHSLSQDGFIVVMTGLSLRLIRLSALANLSPTSIRLADAASRYRRRFRNLDNTGCEAVTMKTIALTRSTCGTVE